MVSSYIQPQLRTELVQKVTGPGQKTKRDHFDMSKVGLRVVQAIRTAKSCYRSIETSSRQKACSPTNCTNVPGLWDFVSAPVASTVYKFTWTSASSFFFCASACAFASSSTSLSWRGGFCAKGTGLRRQVNSRDPGKALYECLNNAAKQKRPTKLNTSFKATSVR